LLSGKDFDDETGKLKKQIDCVLLNEEMARALFKRLETKPWVVDSIDEKDLQPNLTSFYYFYPTTGSEPQTWTFCQASHAHSTSPVRTRFDHIHENRFTCLSAEALKVLEPWLLTFLAKNIYRISQDNLLPNPNRHKKHTKRFVRR